MSKIDELATKHMRTQDLYETDAIRVERAYLAGFLKAQELAIDKVRYTRFSIVLTNDLYCHGYIDACKAIEKRVKNIGEME